MTLMTMLIVVEMLAGLPNDCSEVLVFEVCNYCKIIWGWFAQFFPYMLSYNSKFKFSETVLHVMD